MGLFFETVLMATMAGNLPGNHSQNHISERGLRLLFWEQEDITELSAGLNLAPSR